MEETSTVIDPEVETLLAFKDSGFQYRQRRESDWNENYDLYRDKVKVNRLTQTQSTHIPLMKMLIRTVLKDIDDMSVVSFENLDNDKQKELFLNKYWEWTLDQNKMEIKDIVDKKQVTLYGRSYDQMQIGDGKVLMTIQDPQDLLVDRYIDPTDIDSGRFLIHTFIFVPFSSLEKNTDYDQEKVAKLKAWHASEAGLIKVASNKDMMADKNKKMEDLGVPDVEDPSLGEAIVELSLYFVYDYRPGSKEEELFLKVEADDQVILMKKPLEEVIGETEDHYWRNHFPYNSWADDVERQDWYSDGVGDIIRTANKVLDVWYSQLIVNRTLRNYNMNVYDSTVEGFVPQTFEPIPFGWYPLPGKPSEVYQRLEVADLSESIDEMSFLITMLEKATGATATQQGATQERQITLGEVQLALGEAKERVKGMSKFYTEVWKQRATKFLKLIEAAPEKLDAVKLYTKGKNTDKIYPTKGNPEDWMTKAGYRVKVWSQTEKNNKDMMSLERLSAIRAAMPGNSKLDEIYKRKLLEIAELNPQEVNEVMRLEKENAKVLTAMGNGINMNGGGMGGMPTTVTAKPAQKVLPAKTQIQ